MQNFERGLLIDLHGHGHSHQIQEIGYLLDGHALKQSHEYLKSNTHKSSIYSLSKKYDIIDLMIGENSIGTLLEKSGYPSVPSHHNPAPSGSYFNGGYTVLTHGSKNGGSIDAIQVEVSSNIRKQMHGHNMLDFSHALADSISSFHSHYYRST